jgi:hypothetical protein
VHSCDDPGALRLDGIRCETFLLLFWTVLTDNARPDCTQLGRI